MNTDTFDVIVIGGGPAGSCAAGLLAQNGRSVLLLEKDKHPRQHIGESLITGVWPTLDRLGLRERIEQLGFVRKYGATVRWGAGEDAWGFAFRDTGRYEYAPQVRRAEFDAALLGRARELGVTVLEDTTVRSVLREDGRVVGVTYQGRGDEPARAHATVTIDASGQSQVIARELGTVRYHEDLRNLAVWAYYQGCRRQEGEKAGDTVIENLAGGWFWFIPVGDDVTSVGYVSPTSEIAQSGKRPEEVLQERLEESIELKKMLVGSRRVSAFRTAKDWSYASTTFHGPGFVLVGDAAAFVDPLLSTGVTLAVRGARIAADAVEHALVHPDREEAAFTAYEENCRTFLSVILEFVRFFYTMTKTQAEYHRGAQVLIDPDEIEEPEFDFVQLVSGLAKDEELRIPVPEPVGR